MKKYSGFLFSLLASASIHAAEIKVAAIEFETKSPGFEENIPGILNALTIAAENGAKLMVLPEAVTSGFIYADAKSLMPFADTVPGKTTAAISEITKKYNAYVVVGIYEKNLITGNIFNAAVLVGPNGYIGKYHKSTLATGEGYMAVPGKTGFPVFNTTIGKIGLAICFDDTNIQNLLLPALRGADIIAQPIGSNKIPTYAQPIASTNHSTMANMSTAVAWLGSNVISANSTGVQGPGAGYVMFDGGSSIWDNRGKRLVSAPVSTWTDRKKPSIVYATLNLNQKSDQKEYWLKNRRPELYQNLNNYRFPDDSAADKTQRQVSSLMIQYSPISGNIDQNFQKIEGLIKAHAGVFNLTVLPLNSFLGPVKLSKDNINQYAEELGGKSYQLAAKLAQKYITYVLFSMPEKNGNQYFETAVLIDFSGKQVGVYRKSHLNDSEKAWATAGNDLPVFKIADFGNVAIMIDDEVRIPEITQMYGIYRADLILVPAMYNQKEYGSVVDIPKGIVSDASNRGMAMWYNIPKYSQAYTLVANYIGGDRGDVGGSALYSLTPEVDYYPPNIAPNKEIAHAANFTTHTNKTVFIDQDRLLATRRWDLAAPLALDMNSACFKEWQKDSTSSDLCPKTSSGN